MSKHCLLWTLLLSLLLTPSCMLLRKSQHAYILPPTSAKPSAQPADRTLEAVKLPGYLDRLEMVYLAKTGELVKVSKAKWAQPLGAMLKENLAATLRQRGSGQTSKATVTLELEQFLMDEKGAFQVSGVMEFRMASQPPLRKPVAFSLPSLGSPNAERLVLQSRTALNRLADAICSAELTPPAESEQ